MKLKKRWIVGLATIAIAALVISYLHTSWTTCLFSEQERDDYFRLPANSQGIEEHSQVNSRSCRLWIKFEIPPTDLESFLSTTFIQTPLETTISSERIADLQQYTGQNLSTVTAYLAGEVEHVGSHHLDYQFVFIDMTDPTRYIVYLHTIKNWL